MKKLIETLRSLGIQIPEDREEAVRRTLSENYKNIKEVAKIRKRLESQRDAWMQRAKIAEEALKGGDPAEKNRKEDETMEFRNTVEMTNNSFCRIRLRAEYHHSVIRDGKPGTRAVMEGPEPKGVPHE